MHPKKIDNLLKLNPKERKDYFVRQAVQNGLIWTLSTNKGYIIFKDSDDDEIFPVWSQEELAELCMFQEHRELGAFPVSISLESFLNNCIPDIIEEKVLFGVFYDMDKEAICISGKELKDELCAEYDEIWG